MIKKVVIPTGEVRWEIRVYENGRGSRRIFKRFEKKSDAQDCLDDLKYQRRNLGGFKTKTQSQNTEIQGGTETGLAPSISAENATKRFFISEAEMWFRERELHFSPGHKKRAKAVIEEFRKRFSELEISKVNQEFLYLVQREEIAKGLSNSTVNRKTEIITAILSHSHKLGRIERNPSLGFRKLRKSSKEMLFWSMEEAGSFLSFANQRYSKKSNRRWIYVAYLLALNTGLRAGEIWGLKSSDLSLDRNLIHVRRQFDRVLNKMRDPKSKRARVVPCSEELKTEILAILGKRKPNQEKTIFQSLRGKPVCHDNFSDRVFQRDMRDWGGKR
ncbi:MAG: site-specific integrase, partial [Bdellovibrionales bacterium]|nr:site-specific integrase [Bdellovibrionales bacterium]